MYTERNRCNLLKVRSRNHWTVLWRVIHSSWPYL